MLRVLRRNQPWSNPLIQFPWNSSQQCTRSLLIGTRQPIENRAHPQRFWTPNHTRSSARHLPFSPPVMEGEKAKPTERELEMASSLAAQLNNSFAFRKALMMHLSPEVRRELGLAAATYDLNDMHFRTEYSRADANADGFLSRQEFLAWINRAAETTASEGQSPTKRQLLLLGLNTGIPFIGFGFLDNFLMILCGDAIEASIGARFGLSIMACAALGNTISDIFGIGMSGIVETTATKLGLPNPGLTQSQMASKTAKVVGGLAGVVGIVIGCVLGMVPLLFIDTRKTELEMLNAENSSNDKETHV